MYYFNVNISSLLPSREIFTNNSYTPLRLKKAYAN